MDIMAHRHQPYNSFPQGPAPSSISFPISVVVSNSIPVSTSPRSIDMDADNASGNGSAALRKLHAAVSTTSEDNTMGLDQRHDQRSKPTRVQQLHQLQQEERQYPHRIEKPHPSNSNTTTSTEPMYMDGLVANSSHISLQDKTDTLMSKEGERDLYIDATTSAVFVKTHAQQRHSGIEADMSTESMTDLANASTIANGITNKTSAPLRNPFCFASDVEFVQGSSHPLLYPRERKLAARQRANASHHKASALVQHEQIASAPPSVDSSDDESKSSDDQRGLITNPSRKRSWSSATAIETRGGRFYSSLRPSERRRLCVLNRPITRADFFNPQGCVHKKFGGMRRNWTFLDLSQDTRGSPSEQEPKKKRVQV